MKLFFSLFFISQNGIAATSNRQAATSNNDQWEKLKKVDPLVQVNRFLTLGGLDEYMDQNQHCQEGWKQLGNKCLILLNENQKKMDQKRSCLQLGAKLVSVSIDPHECVEEANLTTWSNVTVRKSHFDPVSSKDLFNWVLRVILEWIKMTF